MRDEACQKALTARTACPAGSGWAIGFPCGASLGGRPKAAPGRWACPVAPLAEMALALTGGSALEPAHGAKGEVKRRAIF